jgi:glycosyltransferase involved in cell wall biosynthesis
MLLVGDGEAMAAVKARCAAEGLESHVLLPGKVPFTDVPRYYSVMDVSLCPRLPVAVTEMVSPLKPFEAMAMAKPVVGSDVAAVAEIIDDGRTGWLFRKGNLESFVDVLAGIAADRAPIAAMGVAARAFVEQRHQWTMIARRIAGTWDGLRGLSAAGRAAAPASTGREAGLRIET